MTLLEIPQVDDEEVSLSDSSLGSESDGDTSDDEEGEAEDPIRLTTSSSSGERDKLLFRGDDDMNDPPDKKRQSLQRHNTIAHLPIPHPDSATFQAFEKSATSKQQLSSEAVTSTLSPEVYNQHILFSQACLELIEERDKLESLRRLNLRRSLGNTGNNNFDQDEDEEYPLLSLMKSGPLLKLHLRGGSKTRIKSKLTRSSSAGAVGGRKMESRLLTKWKYKYVEIRKGMFSYYDNTKTPIPKRGYLVRKNVTLDASTCLCRSISVGEDDNSHPFDSKDTISSSLPRKISESKETRLYAFELVVNGESRVFAARSEAGRQSWIKIINRGMLGCSGDEDIREKKNDPISDEQLQQFLALAKMRAKNFSIESKNSIAIGQEFAVLWGSSVEVPVKCLFAGMNNHAANSSHSAAKTDMQENMSISINETLFRASTMMGCQHRVFGSLTRLILEHNKSSTSSFSEIQASRHARDILKSVGKQADKIKCLRASVGILYGNKDGSVIIEDAGREYPISSISIDGKAQTCFNENPKPSNVDHREWIYVRRKNSKFLKRFYAVLSVGVLCFYKEELPRPHRLRCQLLLVGASIGTCDDNPSVTSNENLPSSPSNVMDPNYTIYLKARENGKWVEQQLCFTKYETFIAWRDVLVSAITISSSHSNVLSFDDMSQQSKDEVHGVDQRTIIPTSSSDEGGVSWITVSDASTPSDARSSRLKNISVKRVASRFVESLPPLPPSFSSPKSKERTHLYPSSLLSSPSFTKSKLLSRKSDDNITIATTKNSSERKQLVDIEIKITKLYTVFLNDAVGPSICTTRSTYIEKYTCSCEKRGQLQKKQEMIKLETLKGKVNESAFRLAFGSRSVPRRRRSI